MEAPGVEAGSTKPVSIGLDGSQMVGTVGDGRHDADPNTVSASLDSFGGRTVENQLDETAKIMVAALDAWLADGRDVRAVRRLLLEALTQLDEAPAR